VSPPAVRAWLTRLYPLAWRNRYRDEFDALLEECLHSPMDVVDVIFSAFDAHLQLINGENVNWRLMDMLNKLPKTILLVFASYIGFIIAGMSLVGILDDSPMIPLMETNPAPALAMAVIRIAAVLAFLAVVTGGIPLAVSVIRRALTSDRTSRNLLLVPIISFASLVFYFGIILLVHTGQIQIAGIVREVQPDNFPLGNRLLLAGLMLVFVLGAIASTWAVWKAISRTDIKQASFHPVEQTVAINVYKFAYIPTVIVTVSMLVMAIATIIWSKLVFSALPQFFWGNFGLWQTSIQPWIYGIITVMVVSSVVAFMGIAHGRSEMAHT
jgi:hypothetical protein